MRGVRDTSRWKSEREKRGIRRVMKEKKVEEKKGDMKRRRGKWKKEE